MGVKSAWSELKLYKDEERCIFFLHSVKVGEDASGPVFISLCFGQG
jgi:hypothetical protein